MKGNLTVADVCNLSSSRPLREPDGQRRKTSGSASYGPAIFCCTFAPERNSVVRIGFTMANSPDWPASLCRETVSQVSRPAFNGLMETGTNL